MILRSGLGWACLDDDLAYLRARLVLSEVRLLGLLVHLEQLGLERRRVEDHLLACHVVFRAGVRVRVWPRASGLGSHGGRRAGSGEG
jgi:hypothetical protein